MLIFRRTVFKLGKQSEPNRTHGTTNREGGEELDSFQYYLNSAGGAPSRLRISQRAPSRPSQDFVSLQQAVKRKWPCPICYRSSVPRQNPIRWDGFLVLSRRPHHSKAWCSDLLPAEGTSPGRVKLNAALSAFLIRLYVVQQRTRSLARIINFFLDL
jgi:hypothetical protein